MAEPPFMRDSIKTVAAQIVSFRQCRVVEVFARIDHPDPLHDGARRLVDEAREGDDFFKLKRREGDTQRSLRCFGRKALSPMRFGQAPANLHAWREWQRPAGNRQAHKSNERARVGNFNRPVAPTAFFKFRLPDIDRSIACLARARRGKVFHDLGIGVHCGERLPVRGSPLTQPQARRCEFDRDGHGRNACRCPSVFDVWSLHRRVAIRSNAVGRLRDCHAVISLAALPSAGWVASMSRSYCVSRCTE